MRIPDKIARNAKAVAAAVAEIGALAGALVIALEDSVISGEEATTLGGLTVAAAGAVYAIWRIGNREDTRTQR